MGQGNKHKKQQYEDGNIGVIIMYRQCWAVLKERRKSQ